MNLEARTEWRGGKFGGYGGESSATKLYQKTILKGRFSLCKTGFRVDYLQ